MRTERERAERLWQKLTRLEAAQDAQDIYIAREYVDLIVAFSREERARVLSECAEYIIETDPQASKEFFAEAKALREEGGK